MDGAIEVQESKEEYGSSTVVSVDKISLRLLGHVSKIQAQFESVPSVF